MNENNGSTGLGHKSSIDTAYEKTWKTVEISRNSSRPYSLDYVEKIFCKWEPLHGDRCFAEDPALVAGIGEFHSKKKKLRVFFLGHQKGRTTQQKIERSFGMARPEGYRKAMRIMEMAERFSLPLLTFIDTPGAFPGIDAEERGQFHAIAACTARMMELQVPSVSVVIGEGGSGGALAIGVPDRLLMLQNSTYSVISPESCASILWSDPGKAKQAAHYLKFTAKDILKLEICDEIIDEPKDGAHSNLELSAERLHEAAVRHFQELIKMTPAKRMKLRYDKYRHVDQKILKS